MLEFSLKKNKEFYAFLAILRLRFYAILAILRLRFYAFLVKIALRYYVRRAQMLERKAYQELLDWKNKLNGIKNADFN